MDAAPRARQRQLRCDLRGLDAADAGRHPREHRHRHRRRRDRPASHRGRARRVQQGRRLPRARARALRGRHLGWNTQDTLYQFNEVSGGKSTCDGQGLDLDEGNIRTIYQYNYSHDNEGGFILLCNGGGSTTADNIVRYNISQNDGGQLFDMVCAKTTNTQIYNNTFYLSKPVEIISNSNGSTSANATFTNNIFHVATDGASYVNAAGLGYDSNVFYGTHPAGGKPTPTR